MFELPPLPPLSPCDVETNADEKKGRALPPLPDGILSERKTSLNRPKAIQNTIENGPRTQQPSENRGETH